MKIDSTETKDGEAIYVPLRTGTITRVETGTDSTELARISYLTGFTPDYRGKQQCTLAYSSMIRSAVSSKASDPDIGDEALVIGVSLEFSEFAALKAAEENDRWIRLTRVLADIDGIAAPFVDKLKPDQRVAYAEIYPRVVFLRWTGISKTTEKIFLSGDAFDLDVDEQYTANVVSSIFPAPQLKNRLIPWQLKGSTNHFNFLDFSDGFGPGVAYHAFPFEPRRPSKRPLALRLSPSAEVPQGVFMFDVHLSVKPKYALGSRLILLALVVVLAMGVVLAAGVVDENFASRIGLDQEIATKVADWSAALGAGLLIAGALFTYYIVNRRAG